MLRKFAIALAAGATLAAGVALAPTEASAWGYRCAVDQDTTVRLILS